MLRSVLAVLGGYLTMVVLVMASLAIVARIAFGGFPDASGPYAGPRWFLLAELVAAAIAALAGGWVTGWIGRSAPFRHGVYLALWLVGMGALSIALESGLKPLWSSLAVPVVGVLGALAGAWLRERGIPA